MKSQIKRRLSEDQVHWEEDLQLHVVSAGKVRSSAMETVLANHVQRKVELISVLNISTAFVEILENSNGLLRPICMLEVHLVAEEKVSLVITVSGNEFDVMENVPATNVKIEVLLMVVW
jgi:hypothetical protein